MPTTNVDPTPDDSTTAGPLTAATNRLIATAAALDDTALSAPSLCAGWTRAHVLTHVARNADGLANLLAWARTGVVTPMYPNREARDAAIEAGASRSVDDVVDDLRTSASRFSKAVMDMPEDSWEREVRGGAGAKGEPLPGRRVLWLRLRELEFHHVDLDAEYGPANWPDAFAERALPEVVRMLNRRDDVPPVTLVVHTADGHSVENIGTTPPVTVSGSSAAAILAWLTGRSAGTDLSVQPDGPLPTIPAWL